MTLFSTDLLNQDPEAFDNYFNTTEKESQAYRRRIERIEKFWSDWPKQEAKNKKAERLSRLKRR
ncbi:hypothetical protein [Pleionea sediminis]|uniref:hypothetical protein n=1 Tax=Pleionea sediminis TaxID=2569479 RepID=UPI001186252A|nr:hypothetical protein [Pleionea sediminis]